ncbi:MAG: glutamate decarboxylase, partial [Nocardioidaceae bacterium]|nr:glutamate decarboxylase [Nocardioidaceae bacterium]
MAHRHPSRLDELDEGLDVRPQFSREGETVDIPRRKISQTSVAPETAYQIIRDELMLDGNARLNVATFVTTWMEPEADKLLQESAATNMIDKDEYPQTAQIESRCLDILADMWHVPSP